MHLFLKQTDRKYDIQWALDELWFDDTYSFLF